MFQVFPDYLTFPDISLIFQIFPECCEPGICSGTFLTHYSPVLLFYTPRKNQKTFKFSDVLRGYRKATPGCNGLNKGFNLAIFKSSEKDDSAVLLVNFFFPQ